MFRWTPRDKSSGALDIKKDCAHGTYPTEKDGMATRERRLAEFNGQCEPPPDQPVQVLCEDHSGTYQLPFPCRYVDGAWQNHESGSTVEATGVGWRMRRP